MIYTLNLQEFLIEYFSGVRNISRIRFLLGGPILPSSLASARTGLFEGRLRPAADIPRYCRIVDPRREPEDKM
jgi:hypothetical protein